MNVTNDFFSSFSSSVPCGSVNCTFNVTSRIVVTIIKKNNKVKTVSYTHLNGLPKIGTWRDMHMRIEGDAVNDLQEIFLTIWNKETKQNVGGAAYFPLHESKTDSTDIIVAIVDRTPKKNSRMLSHAYAMSIYSAQKNVHIVNPYFCLLYTSRCV